MAAAASSLTHCQQAQEKVEDAISSVMKAEQLLRENTTEVRSELQSCVSRQQEALRCREVWLLGQIDLLEQVKSETLQQQLNQLHRLRGQFDVIVHQLQNNNSNDLNNQLTACMEKLSSLSLTPEETPDMSFHADTRSLRQAITSFGRVTAQLVEAVSSQGPAPHRGAVKSSPITAHKQRMEGGALSDWLLDTHRIKSSASIGYHSSKNPQDWLLSQKEVKTCCPALPSMDFLQAWGQLRDLEAWLLHDCVGRERADSSCSSSFSIEKIDESELTSDPEEQGAEMGDWLLTPPIVATETMSDAEQWQRVLKPFESGWASGEWLSESSRPADCASCCQTSRPLEIENLGQLKCLKTPPSSSPAFPYAAATPVTVAALEAWLQQAVPEPQSCRANELCSTYSDCVCEENCGGEALGRWLLQQDGRDKNGVPVAKKAPPTLFHKEQEQKVHAILEAWLHPSTTSSSSSSSSSCRTPLEALTSSLSTWVAPLEEKASREEHSSPLKLCSSSSPFQCPLDPDLWVLPAPRSGGAAEQEEDKWLLKKKTQERLLLPTVCDLFSCMKVGGDKEKWLHRAPVQM